MEDYDTMEIQEIITRLCRTEGPSGFEDNAAKCACELLRPYVDEIDTDVMGNVIAVRRCGRENAPKLMLDAHLDEIGFIVTGYDGGFVKFASIGGVDPRMLPACEIKLLANPPIYGIVCAAPACVQTGDAPEKAQKAEEMCIDVGMTAEQVKKAVPIGTPGVYRRTPNPFGEKFMCGKTMDDRSCFACLVKAAELLKDTKLNFDLYILGSTQEEVGLRGAAAAAYSIYPDMCIAVDVCHAKTPDCKNWQTLDMGGGVVICRGPNMNRAFTDRIIAAAERCGAKYQIGAEPGGSSGTNTTAIQIARGGVCTALLSLPLKYMHTPVEVISLEDAEYTAMTLAALCADIGGDGND